MKEVTFIRQNIEKWRDMELIAEGSIEVTPDRQADAYIDLTTDLAFAQTHYPKSRITLYLNDLASTLHNQIYRNTVQSGFDISDKLTLQVENDWFRFLPDNYWEENEDKEVFDTETVSAFSESASDTSMKLNGVEDGTASYSRMVDLLLDYYFPPEG